MWSARSTAYHCRRAQRPTTNLGANRAAVRSRLPGALVLGNRELMYRLLFASAKETLLEVAADPKHLGARIGVLMVLHTWGQKLEHHPHVHCSTNDHNLRSLRKFWNPFSHAALSSCSVSACRAASNAVTLLRPTTVTW